VHAYYKARMKATPSPLLFALETMLWQSSLFVNYGLPEAMREACDIFGIDRKKIENAAKEKPAKTEAEATEALPVNRLKKPGKKSLATK
jgi:hypothetical protein